MRLVGHNELTNKDGDYVMAFFTATLLTLVYFREGILFTPVWAQDLGHTTRLIPPLSIEVHSLSQKSESYIYVIDSVIVTTIFSVVFLFFIFI